MFQLGLLKEIAKRKSDPRLYADELGKGLAGELDYTLEAANAEKFMVQIFFVFSPYRILLLNFHFSLTNLGEHEVGIGGRGKLRKLKMKKEKKKEQGSLDLVDGYLVSCSV